MNGEPILFVTHDVADGGWEFLCGSTDQAVDVRAVELGEVVRLDPSLRALADLPLGWRAWRSTPAGPWHGLPFLESFGDTLSLLERVRDGGRLPGLTEAQQPLVHAMLAVKTGDREEAERVLRAAYDNAAGSPFGGTVRSIVVRLGLQVA